MFIILRLVTIRRIGRQTGKYFTYKSESKLNLMFDMVSDFIYTLYLNFSILL